MGRQPQAPDDEFVEILLLTKVHEIFKGIDQIVLSVLNQFTMKIFISQPIFIVILGLTWGWVGHGRIFHDFSNIYETHRLCVSHLYFIATNRTIFSFHSTRLHHKKYEKENIYIPKEVLWTCNIFRINYHKHISTHPVINTTYQFPLPNSSWLLIIHSWVVKLEAKSFKLISTSRFFFPHQANFQVSVKKQENCQEFYPFLACVFVSQMTSEKYQEDEEGKRRERGA